MGYRSDVKALVYPLGGADNLLNYDKLKLLMNTTFKDLYESWSDDFDWNDKHRVLMFDANSVKWYESYDEVKNFTVFLDDVQKLGYEYEFMRIGEDDTDVESMTSSNAERFLYVQRSIEVSF